jgi:hypothetical protein
MREGRLNADAVSVVADNWRRRWERAMERRAWEIVQAGNRR